MTPKTTPRPRYDRAQTCDVPEAAARLGTSVPTAYAMIAAGTFPLPVLRLGTQGRNIRIPRKAVDDLLGPLPEEERATA